MDNTTGQRFHGSEITGAPQLETLRIADALGAINLSDSVPSGEQPQNAVVTRENQDRPAQGIALPRQQVPLQGVIRADYIRPNETQASSGENYPLQGSLNIRQNPLSGPSIEVIWRGNFEVPDCPYVYGYCEGIVAHPSTRISPKAYQHARQRASNLSFVMYAKNQFWPDIFKIQCPNRDNVALYFYPGQSERSKHQYSSLLKFMSRHNMMLRSLTGDVELLVFPSNSLEVGSQKLGESFFMWGVFRHIVGDASTSNAGVQTSTLASNSGAQSS